MSSPTELSARLVGPCAAETLAEPGAGRAVAVFAAVIYVEMPGGLICVTRSGVAPGPLAVETDAPATTDWRATGLSTGARAILGGGTLTLGGLRIGLARAQRWSPSPAPRWTASTARQGIELLRDAAPRDAGGLAGFLDPGFRPKDPVSRTAAEPVAELRAWVSTGTRNFPEKSDPRFLAGIAAPLIGLGPGLTPSGDDLLGGLLLGLRATGQNDASDRLAAVLLPRLHAATNPISAALLRAAARGFGAAPLHIAIGHALAGRTPGPALDALARLGHTSGLDALAGAALAIEAVAMTRANAA